MNNLNLDGVPEYFVASGQPLLKNEDQLGQLRARDADCELVVDCEFEFTIETNEYLTIDISNGILRVKDNSQFDFENFPIKTFTVTVSDAGRIGKLRQFVFVFSYSD